MKTSVLPSLLLLLLFWSLGIAPAFAQTGSLKAGAARIDITPPVRPGYEPSGKYEHEKLYVRAIVLDNGETRAALIGCDLADVTNDIYDQVIPLIEAELDCLDENIIISATHSHSACPSGPPPPPFNSIETEPVVKAIMAAVRDAKDVLQPAKIGYGTGKVYLNANREAIDPETGLWTQAANPEGPSDKTLAVVLFTDMNGAPIAAYLNYAMHAVTAFLTGITSADFPGAACRYVEQAFGDDMVTVFTQGASGDQNPLYLRPGTNALASKTGIDITGYEMVREKIETPLWNDEVPHGELDPEVADVLERWIDAMGMIIGEEAIRVMTGIQQLDHDVCIRGAQNMLSIPTRARAGEQGETGSPVSSPPVVLRLGLLGIGNIAIASVNAEIYSLIAQHMKEASSMANTLMVTNANGRGGGYILDDLAYGKNTPRAVNGRFKPGQAEKGIVNGLVKLIDEYLGKD